MTSGFDSSIKEVRYGDISAIVCTFYPFKIEIMYVQWRFGERLSKLYRINSVD